MLPLLSAIAALSSATGAGKVPEVVLQVNSTVDGAVQPCLFVPAGSKEPRPLLVGLHPWSHGYDSFAEMRLWQQQAASRGWHYLQPHFRGPNKNPAACASDKAVQDVLDAVDHVLEHNAVDESRIYVAGVSGGAHMALVMAARAPERWAAVSAWAPITDLAAWHGESKRLQREYWKDLEACCGGAPGLSPEVDGQYRSRSPLFELAAAKDLPVDIATGIHDGHTGSVPIHHTLDAFNVIARARGDEPVSTADTDRLSRRQPLDGPAPEDATFARRIYLRRTAGPSRVTIFEGGHEMLPEAACAWLAQHARQAPPQ